VFTCYLPGAAHVTVGLSLGLALPATQPMTIEPQGARGFRHPVALFGHQPHRVSFTLICILTPLV
jgi:hypothetical protein